MKKTSMAFLALLSLTAVQVQADVRGSVDVGTKADVVYLQRPDGEFDVLPGTGRLYEGTYRQALARIQKKMPKRERYDRAALVLAWTDNSGKNHVISSEAMWEKYREARLKGAVKQVVLIRTVPVTGKPSA